MEKYQDYSNEELYEELVKIDPESQKFFIQIIEDVF